ncbi:hypothetical protein CRENBAI_017841 [Crenichthys baileyi]|uniref:Secreted protein n=1 Tax=Crenichthys baileyi TaxID=28760 RepID=A0AAV9S430_9TELE
MLVCPLRLKLNNTQLLCSAYFCCFLRRNIIVRSKSSSFYTDFTAFYLYFWNGVDECVPRARDGVLSHNVLLSNAQLNRSITFFFRVFVGKTLTFLIIILTQSGKI